MKHTITLLTALLLAPLAGKALGLRGAFLLGLFQEAPVPDGRTFTVEFSHGRDAPVSMVQFNASTRKEHA